MEGLVLDSGTGCLKKPLFDPLEREEALHLIYSMEFFPTK